ncbi:MAG: GntR family transcriptional regulator [Actinomycetota bacterium]|nr:GntR family transcriptional regulator [Actinomycetota bacterium]
MTTGAATYLALADELQEQIERARPDDRLPSEHDLTRQHDVSRITARAALQELERRLLVRRIRGAGTFVSRRIDYRIASDAVPSWSAMVRRAGGEPHHVVRSVVTRDPTPTERDALRLHPGEQVVAVERCGHVDGQVAGHSVSCTPRALVGGTLDDLGDGQSLHDVLRARLGLETARLWCRAELGIIPYPVAALLRLEGRPPTWLLESCNTVRSGTGRDELAGRPVEHSTSWLRADVVNVRCEYGPDAAVAAPDASMDAARAGVTDGAAASANGVGAPLALRS